MPLDPSFIGRHYPPKVPYQVSREKVREFALAVGEANPICHDVEQAQQQGYPDLVAPPTFPIVIAMRESRQVINDPALGLDYSRVVHGEQRFTYSRPIHAGDQLLTTVTIDNIRSAAGNDLITTKSDLVTVDGEHVVTALCTLVSRGTATETKQQSSGKSSSDAEVRA